MIQIKIKMSDNQNNKPFSMIADIEGDFMDLTNIETPNEVPILAVRNMVLFPGVVSPILIGREASLKLVKKAEKTNGIIGVVSQRDPEVEEPTMSDLYEYGVYARVVKQLTLPNGSVTVIMQGLGRMRLYDIIKETPYLVGFTKQAPEIQPAKRDREWKTAMDDLRKMTGEYISVTEEIPDDFSFAIQNIRNDVMALNFVCSNMPFGTKEKMALLEAESMKLALNTAFEYSAFTSIAEIVDNIVIFDVTDTPPYSETKAYSPVS
jgi:ATP-dependent Lon protease